MATKILTQIWDEKAEKYVAHASFDTFDAFYSHALKFKRAEGESLLQVHIPGGFELSPSDRQKLKELGVERF